MVGGYPDLTGAFIALLVIVCVAVPLAIWKVVEVIIWLCANVSISLI